MSLDAAPALQRRRRRGATARLGAGPARGRTGVAVPGMALREAQGARAVMSGAAAKRARGCGGADSRRDCAARTATDARGGARSAARACGASSAERPAAPSARPERPAAGAGERKRHPLATRACGSRRDGDSREGVRAAAQRHEDPHACRCAGTRRAAQTLAVQASVSVEVVPSFTVARRRQRGRLGGGGHRARARAATASQRASTASPRSSSGVARVDRRVRVRRRSARPSSRTRPPRTLNSSVAARVRRTHPHVQPHAEAPPRRARERVEPARLRAERRETRGWWYAMKIGPARAADPVRRPRRAQKRSADGYPSRVCGRRRGRSGPCDAARRQRPAQERRAVCRAAAPERRGLSVRAAQAAGGSGAGWNGRRVAPPPLDTAPARAAAAGDRPRPGGSSGAAHRAHSGGRRRRRPPRPTAAPLKLP